MSLAVGIVGLPNVGKSTLFNALTRTQQAAAANYPFCTIEPNQATVPVPDARLGALAERVHPGRVVAATVDFVDIAGLVRGASKGDGLGNQFLGRIREVQTIIHVVRCFENDDVVHVEGGVDPVRDIQIIETELLLADLQTIEKRIDRIGRQARADKSLRAEAAAMETLKAHLDAGLPARRFPRAGGDAILPALADLQLLTDKPAIYCANLGEQDLAESGTCASLAALREHARADGAEVITIAAQLEAELSGIEEGERAEMLAAYGLVESGLDQTIRLAYRTLGLISFFTAGPMEVRAWTLRAGTLAPQAAGVIHGDFERGFIRAEVIGYDDFIRHGSEASCRASGTLRVEGKDYAVRDGDVVHFLFNV
jgi:ribosome-binding ATPase